MIEPPRWNEADLEAASRVAIERFRQERMREPLRKYLATLDERRPVVDEVLAALLADGQPRQAGADALRRVVGSAPHLEVLRYLAAPPISEDDLRVLADVPSLAPRVLAADAGAARRVYETILEGLDDRRFPWLGRGGPTDDERAAAVLATATLLASRRAETERRHEEKTRQEAAVMAALDAIGYARETTRDIGTLDQAPPPGSYCGESNLGGRKADLIVRLGDRRVLAIECKVSNSATNSIKRLNNDVGAKAEQWLREFGSRQLVPAAVLSGVFRLRNLKSAQEGGLTLFWEHDLGQLQAWVGRTMQARPG